MMGDTGHTGHQARPWVPTFWRPEVRVPVIDLPQISDRDWRTMAFERLGQTVVEDTFDPFALEAFCDEDD